MNVSKNIKIIIGLLGIGLVVFLLLYFFLLKDTREDRLIKEANVLIGKIENFRRENGHLPDSLNEISYSSKKGTDELFYTKYSETNYTVSFVMSIDYNKTYYSDTKTWENGFRKME
mgnify:CR=1 FL=1